MAEYTTTTNNMIYVLKSREFFSTEVANNFFNEILVETCIDVDGVSELTTPNGLSRNDNGIYTFTINIERIFEPIDIQIKFYLNGHYIVIEFPVCRWLCKPFATRRDFVYELMDRRWDYNHYMHLILDKEEQEKIQLELIGLEPK